MSKKQFWIMRAIFILSAFIVLMIYPTIKQSIFFSYLALYYIIDFSLWIYFEKKKEKEEQNE
ncbi:hypothetical protein [Bacillus sp. JJ722]|uniref:hypothetical protein n=1 Tax=Bacillus sp. JJ722 TaxID=3122973 RepID=UPI002FFDD664